MYVLNHLSPIPDEEKKSSKIFIFALLCGSSKKFENKNLIFISIQFSGMHWMGRVKILLKY